MTPPTANAPTAKMTITTTMTIFSQGLELFAAATGGGVAAGATGCDMG
jgi:hypothetical protein